MEKKISKFNGIAFNENFTKNYNEDSVIGYIFEVNIENPNNPYDSHNDLPFLPERMKIRKFHKLVCNLYDKNNYVAHINRGLNHGLILKNVHKVIQVNQKAWLIYWYEH